MKTKNALPDRENVGRRLTKLTQELDVSAAREREAHRRLDALSKNTERGADWQAAKVRMLEDVRAASAERNRLEAACRALHRIADLLDQHDAVAADLNKARHEAGEVDVDAARGRLRSLYAEVGTAEDESARRVYRLQQVAQDPGHDRAVLRRIERLRVGAGRRAADARADYEKLLQLVLLAEEAQELANEVRGAVAEALAHQPELKRVLR